MTFPAPSLPFVPAEPSLPPLHAWYAVSMSEEQARECLRALQRAQRQGGRPAAPTLRERVLDMAARVSLGRPAQLQYLAMRAAARDGHERALTELVYGQLLLSRRLRGAFEHLEAGLAHARSILDTQAYFILVNRHELLHHLPLGDEPRPFQALTELLAEATVIKRLRSSEPRLRPRCGTDTVG